MCFERLPLQIECRIPVIFIECHVRGFPDHVIKELIVSHVVVVAPAHDSSWLRTYHDFVVCHRIFMQSGREKGMIECLRVRVINCVAFHACLNQDLLPYSNQNDECRGTHKQGGGSTDFGRSQLHLKRIAWSKFWCGCKICSFDLGEIKKICDPNEHPVSGCSKGRKRSVCFIWMIHNDDLAHIINRSIIIEAYLFANLFMYSKHT